MGASAEHDEDPRVHGWWVLVGYAGWLSTGPEGEDEEAAPPVLEEPCPN